MLSALLLAALLQDPAVGDGREAALATLHEGFEDAGARRLALESPPGDPAERLLLAAAAFAPERICGLPPLRGELRARALALALEGWLAGAETREPELLVERLRAALDAAAVADLVAEVRALAVRPEPDGEEAALALLDRAERARELLLAAPSRLGLPAWEALALDDTLDTASQLEFLERWVRAAGRPALDRALDARIEDGPPEMRRRLITLWSADVRGEDLPRLQRLAHDPVESVADTALPVWAEHETDAARREDLFATALHRPAAVRGNALRALAANGQEEAFRTAILVLLEDPEPEMRRLAELLLPAFWPPEPLAALLIERLPPPTRPEARAGAMVALARVPAPAAREAAAEWLAHGGHEQLRYAAAVARELSDSAEIDAWLPRLLETEGVPEQVTRPLAVARAAHSEAAREALRRMLAAPEALLQQHAVRALARAGEERDLPLLREIAVQPGYASSARAAALDRLAEVPAGRAWLLRYLGEAPPDYEVRAALVRGLVEHGDAEQRAAALVHALDPSGFTEEAERLGLELELRRAQEAHPRAAEAATLAAALAEAVAAAPGLRAEGLPDPRRAAGEFPRVHHLARALAACLAAGGAPAPLATDGQPAPPLLHAASVLVRAAPAEVRAACRTLAEDSELDPSLRLRATALVAQAGLRLGPDAAIPALERLVAHPAALRAYPWDLAFGLGAESARGWLLPLDRLVEELLLARAAAAPAAARAGLLRPLLEGYASPSNLTDAGWMLLDTDPTAARDFALRAQDWAPLDPRPRELLAAAEAAAGR
jgi:hypothetical protein